MIKKIQKKIRNYLLEALLALLPFMLTLFIAGKIIEYVKTISSRIMTALPLPDSVSEQMHLLIPFIVFVLIIITLILLGLLIRTVIGTWLLSFVRQTVGLIPGLNRIYKFVEQIISMVGKDKESFLKNPVFVEYPSAGIRALGFHTGEMKFAKDRKKYATVFIPTTPNPTSGVLAIIEEKKIMKTDLTTEEALTFILTGGIAKKDEY